MIFTQLGFARDLVMSGPYRTLRNAGRWVLDHIERFPIPIEEISCAQVFGHPDAAEESSTAAAKRAPNFQDF
jgi:hypothetical protein